MNTEASKNDNNEEILSILSECEKHLGYEFKDKKILRIALTHSSIANTRLESNERMEFLGDAILGVIVCEELFYRFPELLEGELTRIKSEVVSRHNCEKMSKLLGLDKFLFIGKGVATSSGDSLPGSLISDVFESVIAAIYLDCKDLETVKRVILKILRPVIEEASRADHLTNYKSILQQYAQKELGVTPVYELLDEKGPDHNKCFEICVRLGSKSFPTAWGMSKKQAEQKAAHIALKELGLVDVDKE